MFHVERRSRDRPDRRRCSERSARVGRGRTRAGTRSTGARARPGPCTNGTGRRGCRRSSRHPCAVRRPRARLRRPRSSGHAVNRWRARIGARTAARLVAEGLRGRGRGLRGSGARSRHPRPTSWPRRCGSLAGRAESSWNARARRRRGRTSRQRVHSSAVSTRSASARTVCNREGSCVPPTTGSGSRSRLVPADDYRFPEMTLLKPVFAVVGLNKLRQLRRADSHG